MDNTDLTKGMYDYGRSEALKLREEAEVIHLKLQITRILVHTLMRIIIQMILMRLLELDFTIVRQGIKPCM